MPKLTEEHRRKLSEAQKARWKDRTHKHCTRCNTTKAISDFSIRPNRKAGAYCVPCARAYSAERSRKHYNAHPELKSKSNLSSRRVNLRKKYGIEPECYDRMLDAQGGKCGICGTDEPGDRRKYFSVDHCHETGAVRGLLCNNCNRGIGLIGDTLAAVMAAAAYLRNHQPANDNISEQRNAQ